MLEVRSVLQFVVPWTRHTLLDVLVDGVGFCMHVNFWAVCNVGGQLILTGTWILLVAFCHHAFSCVCADFPACRFVLCLLVIRVVLTWSSLEALSFFKLKVTTHFAANSPSSLFFLRGALHRTVASRPWLLFLLFGVRLPL